MKRFLTWSLIFFLMAVGLIACLTAMTEAYVNREARFQARADARYVVLGNSHPEQTFNDSLIDHFQNLSQAAETYLYTYLKAKKIFEQNKQIETVFIEFSNTDLLQDWNKWIWGSALLNWRYPIYSPFMGLEEKRVLLVNNFSGWNSCLPLSLKENLSRIIHHDLNYTSKIGGFVYNTREKLDSILTHTDVPEAFRKRKANQDQISFCNVEYLEKLVRYLTDHKKRVFLIRSPLYASYPGFGNEAAYQKILHDKFGSVGYLDFKAFPLQHSDFVDLEHLNYKGARKFSLWFNKLMQDGLLEKENKQQFIDEKMKEVN